MGDKDTGVKLDTSWSIIDLAKDDHNWVEVDSGSNGEFDFQTLGEVADLVNQHGKHGAQRIIEGNIQASQELVLQGSDVYVEDGAVQLADGSYLITLPKGSGALGRFVSENVDPILEGAEGHAIAAKPYAELALEFAGAILTGPAGCKGEPTPATSVDPTPQLEALGVSIAGLTKTIDEKTPLPAACTKSDKTIPADEFIARCVNSNVLAACSLYETLDVNHDGSIGKDEIFFADSESTIALNPEQLCPVLDTQITLNPAQQMFLESMAVGGKDTAIPYDAIAAITALDAFKNLPYQLEAPEQGLLMWLGAAAAAAAAAAAGTDNAANTFLTASPSGLREDDKGVAPLMAIGVMIQQANATTAGTIPLCTGDGCTPTQDDYLAAVLRIANDPTISTNFTNWNLPTITVQQKIKKLYEIALQRRGEAVIAAPAPIAAPKAARPKKEKKEKKDEPKVVVTPEPTPKAGNRKKGSANSPK